MKTPVPALRFPFSHIYNNYVKIVSASTCQTRLKEILIKQKPAIRIIFHVNDKTRAKPLFQELNSLDICQIYFKSSYSWEELKDLHPPQCFPATLKLLTMCMKPGFLNTFLKERDGL